MTILYLTVEDQQYYFLSQLHYFIFLPVMYKVPSFQCPYQHLLFSVFSIRAILMTMKCYLSFTLVCIFLNISAVEHHFIVSLSGEFSTFWILIHHQICDLQIFTTIQSLLIMYFYVKKLVHFDEVKFVYFFLSVQCHTQEMIAKSSVMRHFS